MVCQDVYRNRERQDVSCHYENQDEDLRHGHNLPSDRTSDEFARISKALDLRKGLLELTNNITSVCRGDALEEDEEKAATEDC